MTGGLTIEELFRGGPETEAVGEMCLQKKNRDRIGWHLIAALISKHMTCKNFPMRVMQLHSSESLTEGKADLPATSDNHCEDWRQLALLQGLSDPNRAVVISPRGRVTTAHFAGVFRNVLCTRQGVRLVA